MEDKFYIYFHINPIKNEVFYVGKGVGKRAWIKSGRNKFWKRIFNKYGYEVELIEEGLSEEIAFQREIYWIAQFKAWNFKLTNMTDGGEGICGLKHSEETRKKQSFSNSGDKNGFANKKHSKETLKNYSINRSGVNHPLFGTKHSEETKKKMSESKKGKTAWNKGLKIPRTKESIEKQKETLKIKKPWNKGLKYKLKNK